MSEANAPVRLDYRHIPLAEAPSVTPVGEGVFVALAAPPPVRTVLRLVDATGGVRALEVTRVVEVADADARGECGFYARFVEDDVLAASEKVGSEHLSSGEVAPDRTQPATEPTGPADGSDVGNAAMAMPAPVVVVDDDDDEDAGSETSAADDEDDGEAEASADGAEPSGEADDAAGRRGRAKKRRGKKPRK